MNLSILLAIELNIQQRNFHDQLILGYRIHYVRKCINIVKKETITIFFSSRGEEGQGFRMERESCNITNSLRTAFAFEEYMEVKERKILFCTSFEDHRREGMKHFQPVSDVGIRSALNHCVKRRIHSIP